MKHASCMSRSQILHALEHDGYAIVKNVLSARECQHALKQLATGTHHAHSTFLWNIRSHPTVKRTFAKVWDCRADELVTSFDGASLNTSDGAHLVLDWHVDHNGTHEEGRVCIQGVLVLTKMDSNSGGTAFLKGSHVEHVSICNRLCPQCQSKDDWEFVNIPKSDPVLHSYEHVQPVVPPGSLLLWDSRTVHCVMPPLTCKTGRLHPRGVVYLSMVPRSFVSDEVIQQRIAGFQSGISTTHWCVRFVDQGEQPAIPARSVKASCIVKRLVGAPCTDSN